MCGVSGFWGPRDRALLEAMTAAQAHRGPDGEGFLEHPLASLGHRRLAIIDPAQRSPAGRHRRRRSCSSPTTARSTTSASCGPSSKPLGHTFHTACDTEVVLHAYLEWGTDCFARFNGMWALAILDLRDAGRPGRHHGPRLVLARDHYGIKPLYYARSGSGRVLFASEAKAVLADPELEHRARPASGSTTTCCTGCTTTSRRPRSSGHPGARRRDLGGGRRRRRARAEPTGRRRCRPTRPPIPPSSAPGSSVRSSAGWSPTSPPAPACREASTRRRSSGWRAGCSSSTCPTRCRWATG